MLLTPKGYCDAGLSPGWLSGVGTTGRNAPNAVRKYRRLRPDLSAVEVDSTYTGTVLRFELEQKLDPEDLRRILTWYISLHDLSKPFAQLPSTHLREGVDYFVR